LSRLAIASHPHLETTGQMSEVRDFFGAKRHSVPHLGLILKMINHMPVVHGFENAL